MSAIAIDPQALGTDAPRSVRQLWRRRLARAVVGALGLNGTGAFATEVVQALNPLARIETKYGAIVCRAGHGRLVWRAETFFTEEPDTIEWLDALTPQDVLWDVGANVGLYSVYAAKFRKCRVVAFEPEAQNYALLIENLALNGLTDPRRVGASNLALSAYTGFGGLTVRYVTKGGAYNLFREPDSDIPESVKLVARASDIGLEQVVYSASIDGLPKEGVFPAPTHIKIDVDGIEPQIIKGAGETLASPRLRSVLVELNAQSRDDMEVPAIMARHGFRQLELARGAVSTKKKTPMQNWIFER